MTAGALPTKTDVRVMFGGEHATIPLAHEGAAGVMSPEQVRDLNGLLAWREGILSGGDIGGVSGDVVTRSELNEALSLIGRSPQRADPDPRLTAMEERISRIAQSVSQIGPSLGASDVKRLVADAVSMEAARPRSSPVDAQSRTELAAVKAQLSDLAEAVARISASVKEPAGHPSLKPLVDVVQSLSDRVSEIEAVIGKLKRLIQYKTDAQ